MTLPFTPLLVGICMSSKNDRPAMQAVCETVRDEAAENDRRGVS
jgi:hypothetical protein